jgi:hypothetical protein
MFTNNQDLKGLAVHATDGEIGKVVQLYFDDEIWAIRYLTVETGNWLNDRQVLISPLSILRVDVHAKRIDVFLTRKQVENSPNIDTNRPVSRQHEAEYFGYYGYPYYWDGPSELVRKESKSSHLRSTDAVAGYHIDATDGEIGHVNKFIVDGEGWAIRYLEVATKNWWPGKKVLLSPAWVQRVSWEESKVFVAVTREAIKTCPKYDDSASITREYENNLYFHYGRPPYWIEEVKDETTSFSVLSSR